MKKIILLLFLFAFVACKSAKQNSNLIVVTSEKEAVMNEYEIVMHKIISDSRCPEDVNCVWAGELVMELWVWKNNAIKETKEVTFLPKIEQKI